MNQILDYNPNSKSSNSNGTDKIARVFAIILILFAICLLAVGGYGLYKRSKEKAESSTSSSTKANIEVIKDGANVIIKVSHDKAIDKIIYSWNDSAEKTIPGTGENTMEETISLPADNNTLHIKVIDKDGVESIYENDFYSESGKDILSPVIEISVTPEKKVKIVATDETKIDFITYRWNDDKEEKIEASDDDKKIETELDILKGTNDLTVVAVDSNNNTTTENKSFTGVTKPEIKVTVSADKKSIDVAVNHEKGIKEIKLNINDVDYNVDIGTENPPSLNFNVPLNEGNNKIKVSAKSVDSTETIVTEEVNNSAIQDNNNSNESQDSNNNNESQGQNNSNNGNSSNNSEIIINLSSDGNKAEVVINNEDGIKEVKLNLNDVDYNVDIGTENPSHLQFEVPLVEGNNKIIVKMISTDGTEKTETKELSH